MSLHLAECYICRCPASTAAITFDHHYHHHPMPLTCRSLLHCCCWHLSHCTAASLIAPLPRWLVVALPNVGNQQHDMTYDMKNKPSKVACRQHVGRVGLTRQDNTKTCLQTFLLKTSKMSTFPAKVATSTPNWSLCCVIQAATSLGMMRGSGSGKIGGRRVGGDDSYNRWVCTSINHGINDGGRHCPMATPCFEAYNNQQTYYATGLHC